MDKILLVGAKPVPVTGQSEAFRYVCEDAMRWGLSRLDIIYNNRGSGYYSFLYFFLYCIEIMSKILIYRYDTIYITISRTKFGFLRDFPILALNLVLPIRVVVHLHGADFLIFRNSLNPFILNVFDFLYKRISIAIVLTSSMREQFEMYPQVDVRVISNSAPSKLLKISRPVFNGRLKVLYLSNLMASKGVLNLSLAVKELLDSGVEVELILAGNFLSDSIMDSEVLIRKVNDIIGDAKNKISYVGVVSGKSKENLFEWCNVVALPSQYITEAQPLVLVEAMMSGRCLIAANHNYISDMVRHLITGYLIDNNSVKNIKIALLYFVKNENKLFDIGCNNRKLAVKKYAMDDYLLSLKSVLCLSSF